MNEVIETTPEERDSGFTLVELLIVIVVLGILAAVTVFAVGGITSDARTNSCALDQKSVNTAAEAYRAREGSYPANVDALVPEYLTEAPAARDGCTISVPS